MDRFKVWKVIIVFFNIVLEISASTHWVVTENGRIQSELNSPYHLRQPDDLLALLEQEHRTYEIERLYNEMSQRKATIDMEWLGLETAKDLETRLYSTDADCLQAGRPLSDTDLYVSVADDAVGRQGLDNLEELVPNQVPSSAPDQPDCAAVVDLDFSMRVFPHLQALSWNLKVETEVLDGLKSLSEVTGRQIAAAMHKNRTSWFLHNLASLYWRTQGDTWRAIQCAKRAVHFSPREHRDVAMLNLGSVVQQARCPAEAAIVLHAAVDHAPLVAASHFALANVYAILGDYNRSVACYDNTLKLSPHWSTAAHNRCAVLCHHKLENTLYQLHKTLQGVLGLLHDYHTIQEQWLKHQEQLLHHQAPLDVRLQGFHQAPLSAILTHKGQQRCIPEKHGSQTVLNCDSKVFSHHIQVDISLSLQMLLKNVEDQAEKINEQMSRRFVVPRRFEVQHVPEEAEAEREVNLEVLIEDSEERLQREASDDDIPTCISLIAFKKELRSGKEFSKKLEILQNFAINLFNNINSEGRCKSPDCISDCLIDEKYWMEPDPSFTEKTPIDLVPVAKILGLIKKDSWIQNTSSRTIGTLLLMCLELTKWDTSEIEYKNQLPMCSGGADPLGSLSADSFRAMREEPRLKEVLPTLLLEDNAHLGDFTDLLSHALKDHVRHSVNTSWLLDTAAALYWRSVANPSQMVACLQAAVQRSPPAQFVDPLQDIANMLLALGHDREAVVLTNLVHEESSNSIFNTYVAMVDTVHAGKYSQTDV